MAVRGRVRTLPWFEGLVRVSKSEVVFPCSGGSIEFKALTIANARSAHVPVVVFDEADEMDPEILRIARYTTGTKGAERSRVHYISTQNHPDGIIERLVRLAPERGIGVYHWNYKEASEPCPDDRSGTTPVDAWVHPKTLVHRADPPPPDEAWKHVRVLDGCLACPLIDTDYNEESFFVRHAYFLGANDPYSALKTTLRAEVDPDAWATLHSDTSRPFDKPNAGRIAVKVINHLGDEVMKIFKVG